MKEKIPKPDDAYLISVGRRIKLTSDPEAQTLLDQLVDAYKRCNGTNLREAAYRTAERRMETYLRGKELRKTERIVKRGKQ